MTKTQKRLVATASLVGITLLVIVFLFGQSISRIRTSPETLEALITTNPILAPFVIILIIIIEVVIAPLPGGFIPIVTGALFGIVPGTIYSWLGNVIGASLAWLLANKLGHHFVEKLFLKRQIAYYNAFIERHQLLIWIMYIFPIFPIDVISFCMGLSAIRFKKFVLLVTLALLPHMLILNLFGELLFNKDVVRTLWAIGGVIISIVVYSYVTERRRRTHS